MIESTFGCRRQRDKIGVLLAQLGTPDEPTKPALRRYLKQFLSDPRVIEVNRALWWVVLNGIILNTRPKKSAALYKRIWTPEGSPLLRITEQQVDGVKQQFQGLDVPIEVEFGMRYGSPSLESAIDKLIEQGCTKLLLFPMYPQYSAPTTASTYDAVFRHLLSMRFVPTLRVAEPYYLHPGYVNPLAFTINEFLAQMEEPPERLIMSYHGVPQSYVKKGDPYCCMCTETTQALLPKLEFPQEKVIQTYQSRFGSEPWLTPYTDDTIEKLAKEGVKRLAVVCPGFTTDCLETLDEIGNEAEELFHEHGGETLVQIPCLNAHPTWIEGMATILEGEMGSWIETAKRHASMCQKIACPTKLDQSLLS